MKINSKEILLGLSFMITMTWLGCNKEHYETFVDQGTQVYTGTATATQAIPAKTGNGTATISAYFDANNKVFNYTVKWSQLDSTATSVSFYGPYSTSQPYVLLRTPTTFGTPLPTGNAGSTSYAIFQLNALSDFDLDNLRNGLWYFVVNTTASPTGAVRGRISYVTTTYADH
ncbi:hypothetical protein BEL04_12270 [Mucilaginibacter sp. PPCGB 2223]|uniref:CHRD domain-containing protein n=1 Tax=Mucilaginibacter sp. PPCGB 2223 TaxID=1886027 RepID=UPI000824E603|nr:CHRD domain-containing protein [Mucilaginibacter sp. PPCGB 2223]OCX52248.1 hypothetical protein BEL04_12270 [Mucilaginibacter sp. PPCGB 2223]